MELGVQAKLLRLIQDGELCPVGEEVPHKIDVRVVAATNRNLETEVAAGRFRADLYWRLNVFPIEMPSLSLRQSDIVRLSEHFVIRANERHRRQVQGFDPQAQAMMKNYHWPGNIRELENLVERLVIVKGSGVLTPADLPAALRASRVTPPARRPRPRLPRERDGSEDDPRGGRGEDDRRGAGTHQRQQEPRRRAAGPEPHDVGGKAPPAPHHEQPASLSARPSSLQGLRAPRGSGDPGVR